MVTHYSLIYGLPEENNVKKTCDELGGTLIAYSPLGLGSSLLTYELHVTFVLASKIHCYLCSRFQF